MVGKEMAALARSLRRLPLDPRLSPTVQLNGGYFGDPLNFLGISERLTGQRIASIQPPPAFLLIEPTRPYRSAFGMKSLSSLVAQLWIGDRRPFRAAESTPLILIENGEILSQLLVPG